MTSEGKNIRLPRVRESCKPCRQRKTRCNAEIPCQSCTLRGTESDCTFSSNPHPPSASDHYGGGNISTHASRASTSFGYTQSDGSAGPAQSTPLRASGSSDAARLRANIAKMQNELDAIARREQSESNRALWRALLEILPPRRACETLLEYVLQECDWQWQTSNLALLWTSCVSSRSCTRGQAITLCVSLALPIFVLRSAPHPLYPIPRMTYASEEALYRFALSLAIDKVQDLEDVNAMCDFCVYLIYTQALHELPVYVSKCEELALEKGYLDETSEAWAGVEGQEREWRRQVVYQLLSMSRWKQMYTCHDNFAHVQLNVCRPDMRPVVLTAPVYLDLPLQGGANWPDRGTYREPMAITNASEFRVLRIKPSEEQERTARFQRFLLEATEMVPAITRIQIASAGEARADEAHSVYLQLLRIREVRKADLGFQDELLEALDMNEDVQRRLALQILVARSGVSHIMGYLLRPWLLSASTSSLSPESGYPTLHARLATAALDNAEYSMKAIPLVQAMLPYPQANMIGAFISANLFNAATAFAVPVLRAVQAWRNASDGGDAEVRQLPAWPASFYPHHFGRGEGSVDNLPTDESREPYHPGHQSRPGHASPGILDGNVRTYANWILLILDTLTLLKSNYLGKEAEARLRALVDAHHIRDGTAAGTLSSLSGLAASHPPIAPDLMYTVPAIGQASAPSYADGGAGAGHGGGLGTGMMARDEQLGPMGMYGGGMAPYGPTGRLSNGAATATDTELVDGPGAASGSGMTGRQSQLAMAPAVTMATVADADAAADPNVDGSGAMGSNMGTGMDMGMGMGVGADLRWLDELLSMDQSVWDGLLKDGSREIGM